MRIRLKLNPSISFTQVPTNVELKQKFYDDRSGEVVPIKHPDLSTQPSILPYKFAGNYVYEQMFYVTTNQILDSLDAGHIVELGGTEAQDVLVIDSFISGVFVDGTRTVPSSFIIKGTVNYSLELHILSLEDAVAIIDQGLQGCWIRVVYTTKPKAGGYYYASEQEQGITFSNNTPLEMLISTARDSEHLLVVPPYRSGILPYTNPLIYGFLTENDGITIEISSATFDVGYMDAFADGAHVMHLRKISFPFEINLQTGNYTNEASHLQTECPDLYDAIKNGKNVIFNIEGS